MFSDLAKEIVKCMPELRKELEIWEKTDAYKDLQEYLESERKFNEYLKQNFVCGVPIK